MRTLFGFLVAGALLAGSASSANAQFSLTIGNPYGGGFMGNGPLGYNTATYSSSYSGLGGYGLGNNVIGGYSGLGGGYSGLGGGYGFAPGATTYYNSGYSGYNSVTPIAPTYGYRSYAAPGVYRTYRYRAASPFRPFRRAYRGYGYAYPY